MNSYKYLHLVWLIPASFLFLILHQTAVYYGTIDTYENGTSYTAEVTDFEIKRIATQTNGHVVFRFETHDGEEIQQKLSLPVEMAEKIYSSRIVPVRYQPGAFQEIIIMQTYELQKDLVLTNIAIASVGFLITLFLAIWTSRYANRKLRRGDEKMVIERVE
ncbi:MAG TPA: DUF3592 domain-containing protein [Balneolaceae bacterium]|nr:DUF3592 domain-containing protein [Balneolaceae bacterium]